MKLTTAFAVATLAGLTSADQFNLRAVNNRVITDKSSSPLDSVVDARVVIKGLQGALADADFKIIHKSLV